MADEKCTIHFVQGNADLPINEHQIICPQDDGGFKRFTVDRNATPEPKVTCYEERSNCCELKKLCRGGNIPAVVQAEVKQVVERELEMRIHVLFSPFVDAESCIVSTKDGGNIKVSFLKSLTDSDGSYAIHLLEAGQKTPRMIFADLATEQDAKPLLDVARERASRFWHLSFARLLTTNQVRSAEVVQDPKYGELMSVSDGKYTYFLPMDDRNIFMVKKGEEILFFYGNLNAQLGNLRPNDETLRLKQQVQRYLAAR